jgi:uncharacterized protein (TIGR04255 family)
MMAKAALTLDWKETFPHLSHPPIVEAAIHWQARAQIPLEPEVLRSVLAQKLPEFRSCEPLHHIEMMATMSNEEGAIPQIQHLKGWYGYRLTSGDRRYIVQFTRDGVVFSRTQGYEDWERFTAAAKPVWLTFVEIAAPVEIQRLGVRFINQLPAATLATLEQFLCEPPTCPQNLSLKEFVYQSTFMVLDHPYEIRVIKMVQPSLPGLPQSSGLFLDCDVFTTKPIACDEPVVDGALAKMRWLKNKIFFTLLTDQAVQSLQ